MLTRLANMAEEGESQAGSATTLACIRPGHEADWRFSSVDGSAVARRVGRAQRRYLDGRRIHPVHANLPEPVITQLNFVVT